MTVYAIGATSLTGGGEGALDAIYADDIGNGDPAFVFIQDDALYHYVADSTSGAAESSPDVIAPDEESDGVAYSGDLRWIRISTYAVVGTSGTPEANDIARFTDANTVEGRSYSELKSDLDLEIGTDVLAQQTIGIADDNLLEVDDADAADNDYAKFTANGLEGRSYAEVREDLDLEIGIDVLAQQTIGIADDNLVEMDDALAAANEYAKFTVNGLEGRSYAEVREDLDLEIGVDVLAQQTIGIADDNLLEVDGSPNTAEYARFTANGLEGRTESEFKSDFNLEIGTDVQAYDAANATTATKLDDFAAPDDNTDLNATTSAHGLLPKLGGGNLNYLRADGTWAEPAGVGGITEADAIALIIALG